MVNKIKDEVSDLYIFVNNINYEIKINNKCIEREERIIYFCLKKYIDNLNEGNVIEFFVDVTFKTILKKFHPYKLLGLSGILKKENIPRIISFILLKYLAHNIYNRIFNYLYENFKFILN